MTKEILIILACVPLYVVNAFCDKFVSAKDGNKHNLFYNCVKFAICAAILFPLLFFDHLPKLRLGCVLCGVACGVMYAISKTVMLKGYEKTSVAFMTLCHSSGMILPCLVGHFFWEEPLSVLSAIGMLLAVSSIVLLKSGDSSKTSFDPLGVLFGIIIFLTSGGIMVVQKLMGVYFSNQSVTAYNVYSFIVPFLLLSALSIVKKSKDKTAPDSAYHGEQPPIKQPDLNKRKTSKQICFYAIGSAVSLSAISLTMTLLAGKVPSVLLFPLFNGLGIISVCLGSVFVFHEKMTAKKLIGLFIGVAGLCLVNF